MLKNKLKLLALPLIATLSLNAANPFDDPFFSDPFGDDIFKEMMQMQKEMDKMFQRMQERRMQRSSGLVSPLGTYKMAVRNDFSDKGDHYELITNIPESKENHIDINTANGIMSVTAKIVHEEEQKQNGMISRSSSVRVYQQSVNIPADADESSITTAYKNNRLVISIKKKAGAHTVTQSTNAKPQAKASSSAVKKEQTPAEPAKNAVEITKEFEQTPKSAEKKSETGNPKESNSTIKKEIIHSDKASVI